MTDTLDLILIPTASRWLVYPKTIVRNIYPYAPSLTVEHASEFVVGSILVNNAIIPILDFDFDNKSHEFDSSEGFRITMIDTVFEHTKYMNYAVLSYRQPINVTVDDLSIKTLGPGDHRYIAQQVAIKDERLENKACLIPDLLSFESELKMR